MSAAAEPELSWSVNWRFCVSALIAAKQEFPVIPRTRTARESWKNRDGTLQVREFLYADRGDILKAIMPPLWAHGFDLHQTIVERALQATLVSTLLHTSGEWMRSTLPLPNLRGAGDPHEVAGQLTQHYRYGLTPLLQIVTEEPIKAAADLGVSDAIAPPAAAAPSLPAPGQDTVRTTAPADAAGTTRRVRAARSTRAQAASPPPQAVPEASETQAPGGAPPPAEAPPAPREGGDPSTPPAPAAPPPDYSDDAIRVVAQRALMADLRRHGEANNAEAVRAAWEGAATMLAACSPTEMELLFDHYVGIMADAPPPLDGVVYPKTPEV